MGELATLLPKAALLAAVVGAVSASAATLPVMPLPSQAEQGAGLLSESDGYLDLSLPANASARLKQAVAELNLVRSMPSPAIASTAQPNILHFKISVDSPGPDIPVLGEDESYDLVIRGHDITLSAKTDLGALHGLATLSQLTRLDGSMSVLQEVTIHDQPRFRWRGLMIDVARHWQPIEVIKRNLIGMELVKLNVLHLHLSDDQGFRVESKTHPELQEKGSDGHYFTQDQLREIVRFAAERGIRVVPEFDVPGHATSWLVSHPELASQPGPYQIERQWGIFDPVFDPTNEATYALMSDVLGEMADLFPDPFFHIGGDENNGVQWNANPKIQTFIKEHNLKDNAGVHTYFNARLAAMLAKHGKRIIGWDEVLNPNLPKDSVIDSWRGPAALGEAAKMGFQGILSNGFYIDLSLPASDHYLADPVPPGSPLTAEEAGRVLGGEATMWSEWVSPQTIDSRIWPRTAVVAERLWSPAGVRDVPDMYRRLAYINSALSGVGLQQDAYEEGMLRYFVGPGVADYQQDALKTLISLVEPVKVYKRGHLQPWMNERVPLIYLADAAHPESLTAHAFNADVSAWLFGTREAAAAASIADRLRAWGHAAEILLPMTEMSEYPAMRETKGPSDALVAATEAGLAALDQIKSGAPAPAGWAAKEFAALDKAAEFDVSATLVPHLKGVRLLVAAAAKGDQDRAANPAAWQAAVEASAKPAEPKK